MKRLTTKFSRDLASRKCEGNIGKAFEQKKICQEVERLRELIYHGDRVSASGGIGAAVTARTRCVWDVLRECGELQYGRRFLQKRNGAVNESYVGPAIQYIALTPPLSTPLAPDNCRQIHMWRVRGFLLGSPPEGR